MKNWLTCFGLLMVAFVRAQDISPELLQQMLGNSQQTSTPGAAIDLQSLSAQGGMNPYLRMILQDSLRNIQMSTESSNLDSMLLVYADSALASPKMDDSLRDSNEVFSSKRYVRNVFHGAKASLFSSVTGNVGGDYPLKAGDQLQLILYGEFEKAMDLEVNTQGMVMVDGVGLISLSGLNLKEAEVLIKNKLSKVHRSIRNGNEKISLSLAKLSPIKVFLLGEVTRPGGYVFHGNTSAMLALYFAEGPNENGSVRNIQIYRGGDTLKVDLYDFLFRGDRGEGSVLRDGDVVYLPRAELLAEVTGDVGRPGIYEIKESESIKELLYFAGEVNPSASNQAMTLRRFFEDGNLDIMTLKGYKEYREDSSFKLSNGDVLFVPSSTKKQQQFFHILGAVQYPNAYQLEKGMRVKKAIEVAGGPAEDAYLDRVQIIRGNVDGSTELLSYSLSDSAAANVELMGRDTLIVFSQKEFFRPDSVEITGAVKTPGKYEYFKNMTVKDLLLMAGGGKPFRERGKMRLERLKEMGDELIVYDLNTGEDYNAQDAQIVLYPNDRVVVPVDPEFHTQEVVKLRGAFLRPGDFSLAKDGESLKEFIIRMGVSHKNSYLGGARFYRLTGDVDLLSIDTGRVKEQLALDFVKALNGDERNNITLQHGDSIFIPVKKVWVKVRGEVGSPTNVLYKPGENIYYYISRAGGFTPKSDGNRVIVTYANGEKMATDTGYEDPDPGAEIFVPKAQAELPMDWMRLAQVISNIFVSVTPVILSIILLEKK